MKTAALILMIVLFGKGCKDEAQNDINSAVIEYTANTRGFYGNVVIQNKTVLISRDRDKKADASAAVKVSESDLKELITAFQEVNLEEMPNLKSPTEKRFYDGAAIADLQITYQGKTYKSQSFDHGNPPVEIERLVNKVASYLKRE